MSKSSIQIDTAQSDSDLSLQLSDASSLSSDSDLSEAKVVPRRKNKKKPVKKTIAKKKGGKKKNVNSSSKKSVKQYCICRKGYDGKEFMIECEECKEWFHGACVGLKPNSVSDHYACASCTSKRKPVSSGKTLIPPPPPPASRKKSTIVVSAAPPPPPTPPQPPVPAIAKLSIADDEDEDEDLDDICVLCDGDCTCNVEESVSVAVSKPSISLPSPPTPSPPQQPQRSKTKIIIPVPKKSTKLLSSKKSRVLSRNDSSDDSTSSSSSDSSDESLSESESDSDHGVVERIGIETKKRNKSKAPKKKALPKKSAPPQPVRRGKSTTLLANIIRQKAPPPASKLQKDNNTSDEEDSDEELIVDDLDDLLETMSPLSEHSSNESGDSLLGSGEEFFTDDDDDDDGDESDVNIDSSVNMSPYATSYSSSIHIDSGDDEDIENVETQKIIDELTLDGDEEENDSESGLFVEDEYDDEEEDEEEEEDEAQQGYYAHYNNHWSSSSEDEEEEEFDYTTAMPSEDEGSINSDEEANPLLPLLDSDGNLYNNIASVFMQALAPNADIGTHGDNTTGANTPVLGEDYQLSPFELANALSALSAETTRQHNESFIRRPSLPSSAVSAARRMRGSQDFTTSEALRALSALASDDLPLALEPIQENEDMSEEEKHQSIIPTPPISTEVTETATDTLPAGLALSLSTDLKLQEQILDILHRGSGGVSTPTEEKAQLTSLSCTSPNTPNTPVAVTTPTTTANTTTPTTTTTSAATAVGNKPSIYSNPSRQILPKPSGSGSYFPSTTTSALEQQIHEALIQSLSNKRKAVGELESEKKRPSRSNSLGANTTSNLPSLESTSFSTPASPAAIIDELEDMNIKIDDDDNEEGENQRNDNTDEAAAVSMDDLVDTSQLYTRSSSRSPSPEIEDSYSRDLSRWQRIPIGAFRLMRSKNKLWLER